MTPTKTRPHKPMLAEWTSEILSLSLGLIFHESGTMSYALQRLAHNAVGACAKLRAKFRGLLCQQSFPMMRRLFDALVLPTMSYGSEVQGPSCSPSLPRDIKKMADVQIAFFRQLCRLKKSVTPAIILREISERPWVHRWWNQVIGLMHRLSNMPDDSIHAEFLRDNIADAQQHPSCGDWAGGIVKQYSRLGMVSPFSSSGITCLNSLGFQANMEGRLRKVWGGLHVSPRTAPSKGAKLCTYFAWFLRPTQLKSVPYFEIPMPISRLRLLMQFRMGSHALPVELGRLATPTIPSISAAALCARPGHWGMKGILCLTALILSTFAAVLVRCIKMLMVPCIGLCSTRTRRLSATA